jgi:hypothetical protein
MSRVLTAIVVLLLASNAVHAEEWKSPDGVIAVTIPDPTRFIQTDAGPEALASWELKDESLRIVVGEMPLPPGPKLRQSGLEQGLMREVNRGLSNGRLVASSVQVLAGHELFSMTAMGERDGVTVYFTQIICPVGSKAYKVAVAGIGKDTRSDPDATRFMSSVRIIASAASSTTNQAPPTQGLAPTEADNSGAKVSQTMGYIAGMVLFIAGIAWLFDRTRRKGKSRRRKKS